MKRAQEWVSRNRIPTSVVLGSVLLLLARPTLPSLWVGFPLLLASEAIRIWSSGYIEKDTALSMTGPYSIVRNPLYLGNFLIGLSFCVIGKSILMLFLFLAGFYFIYKPTIETEEGKLRQKFGQDYIAYCAKTPRLFPSFSRTDWVAGPFSWGLILRHQEYLTIFGIMGILVVLTFKARWMSG